ncbi:MAG: UDP-N-acetylmuramate dehydrogenase [Flavobacterium sp.]|nr:UDP-N-acetylmuramate dehydrogenase [Pedobacter sp.]
MPQILQNVSLTNRNTFGVEAYAQWFCEINNEVDLKELYTSSLFHNQKLLVLGGGSNLLFTKNFEGLVIHLNNKSIRYNIDGDDVFVSAGAGKNWNELVTFCVDHEFAGMENLSLIPGSVGASPVQNIGAYGVELMDIFHSCRAFEIETGNIHEFDNAACHFSYRNSIFKQKLKGKFIITEVTFKLSKNFYPKLDYGEIKKELKIRGLLNPSIVNVSEVVSHIRINKLPDPATIGNAGSFFKNPVIGVEKFGHIKSVFPDIIYYIVDNDHFKLAAGWLIEQCGWKGKVIGNTGTWKNQALVLVNHGKATGAEIFNLSSEIINSVQKRFEIVLEREVHII